ncbi:MAG: methylmalonyl Co-A mutase-associated GTPase MeaB [Candidatus Latescibacteria bacterium]|nr:methylmalonyl Co-A mutase-associated GTPase MeaB [bacterium]MBD3425564.1 methylmalonyl Co-A mutase-associated GTPase MeaB [Candidatus Latescibacterota bacterium]
MRSAAKLDKIVDDFRAGNTAATGRLLSIMENGGPEAERVIEKILPDIKGIYRIGFTGPPGAGKSTLISRLASYYRKQDEKLGIIVVDPSSPFSGGALLGDRVRMQNLSSDPGIFVRSLANRGTLGGISNCTDEAVDIFDASGKDVVFIETVGVGQSELAVAEKTHTVVVILVPESGDGIQAMKAGLMEIGDIFVMNKSDHQDAGMAAREIEASLKMKRVEEGDWEPRVILTSGLKDEGVDRLKESLDQHRKYLEDSGLMKRKRREILYSRVRSALIDRLDRRIRSSRRITELVEARMEDVYHSRISPYTLVHEIDSMIKIE